MQRLKIGIIASGMMGQRHTEALGRIPNVEVIGVADPYAGNLSEKAAMLGIPQVFSDYREMIDTLKPDLIHNCTPNNEHYEVNRYAIEHGVGVFSEKPLATTLKEAERLVKLAAQYHVPNGVDFCYRNNAMVREMKARLASGDAGRNLLVHGSYLQDWLMFPEDFNWRLESEKGGASRATADIGSHWFDTVQVILDKKITGVYAKLMIVYPTRKKPIREAETFAKADKEAKYQEVGIDTEDAGFILIRFEDGSYGSLTISQVSGGYKNALNVSVDCEKYSMRWNQEEADHMVIGNREYGEIKLYAASGSMTGEANEYATLPGGHPVGWADTLSNNIKQFYKSIFNNSFGEDRQTYATFKDAAYIMRIVDACMESSRLNQWISI
jgi:predicted dehydrogenase